MRDRSNHGRADAVPALLGSNLDFGLDDNGDLSTVTAYLLTYRDRSIGAAHIVWPGHTVMATLSYDGNSHTFRVTDTVDDIRDGLEDELLIDIDRLVITPGRWVVQSEDFAPPDDDSEYTNKITCQTQTPIVTMGPTIRGETTVASAIELVSSDGSIRPLVAGDIVMVATVPGMGPAVEMLTSAERSPVGLRHELRFWPPPNVTPPTLSGDLILNYPYPNPSSVGDPYLYESITWDVTTSLATALEDHPLHTSFIRVIGDRVENRWQVHDDYNDKRLTWPLPEIDYSGLDNGWACTAHLVSY